MPVTVEQDYDTEEYEVSVDPAMTDPEAYRVVFENDRVRVLEYRDQPDTRPNHIGIRTVSCTR